MVDTQGIASPATNAESMWSALDAAWKEAFGQAWEALRTGNIAVGAVAASADGSVVHAARNRVADAHAPSGEVFGSSLAHAEMNVLARLAFRQPRQLVLTTTLQPCLQCSAAIRFGPVSKLRIAGADPLWDGCHDFSSLSPREAKRPSVDIEGPRLDEIGAFGTLISRFGLGLIPSVEEALREAGQGASVDLAKNCEASGEVEALRTLDVAQGFARLWPELNRLVEVHS